MNGPEHPGEVALADEFHGLPARSQEMPSETEALMSQWWEYARNTGRALRAGNPPPRVDVWGPILEPDEQGRLQAEMSYSRFYGTDSSYRHNNLFVFGKTDFVLGGYGSQRADESVPQDGGATKSGSAMARAPDCTGGRDVKAAAVRCCLGAVAHLRVFTGE